MAGTQEFYRRLEKLIKESKKSFNQVERELNLPRNTLHNYRKSVSNISGVRLILLSHYFNVTPEYLLGMENDSTDN